MDYIISIYSNKNEEIKKFLQSFYSDKNITLENNLYWTKKFNSPFEIIDIASCYIDNIEKFELSIWVSIDKNTFLSITKDNINDFIKYIYERFPI